jgi:hypothetical protein
MMIFQQRANIWQSVNCFGRKMKDAFFSLDTLPFFIISVWIII